jgi:two-component system OmpR family sensor kinase
VFRTLRMRLLALYVFVAVLLVLIVGAAIAAFALSTFAGETNAAIAEVSRNAPEVARHALAGSGSLEAAAPLIVRQLATPGIHIVLLGEEDGALTRLESSNGLVLESGRRGVDALDRSPLLFRLNVALGLHRWRVTIPGGVIVISPDPHPLEKVATAFGLVALPVGLLVVILALLLGRYITGEALRPLIETTQSLRRFAAGDFTPHPIVIAQRNEIGELVTAYNGAVAQVSLAFEERRKADQEMRQFIADAGHELRTPLTVIMGFIDVLRRRTSSDPVMTVRIYETMQVESRRMKVLVDKLIVLARLENVTENASGPVSLPAVAERVIASLSTLETPSQVTLRAEHDVVVNAHENELGDALRNLVENALKYAPESPIELEVRASGDQAIVDVIDYGPGIGAEEQLHVFDRFYRGSSRGESEGFGLGLAIAKRVVERAGGTITLRSVPGEGSHFTISLPRIDPAQPAS